MNSGLIIYYIVGVAVIFGTAGITYWLSCKFQKSIPKKVLYILIGLSAYIFIAQYLRFQSLHMYVDLSHWVQVVKNIAISWVPESLDHTFIFPGTKNYFSIHFAPLIYIFAPAFSIIPSPKTLLILQGIFMFSSVIPLYLLARKIQGSKIFALFVATLFLWYPTFQYITMYEFEMLRFSVPILLWMLYFWEQKRWPPYFLFALLAILVREEVGLTIFMFGIYLALVEKERVKGFITSALGIGSFLIIISAVIPLFNTVDGAGYMPLSLFAKFGNTPLAIAQNILMHPGLLLVTIFDYVKIANIGMLFIPLLLIPFLAPAALINIMANIGVNLMSEATTNTSYMLYYIAPSIPFIFYAFIKAWPKLTRSVIAREAKRSSTLADRDCRDLRPRNDKIEYAIMAAVLSGLLVSNIFFGPSPISLQFWSKNLKPAPFRTQDFHYSVYKVTDHHRRIEQFVNLIPDDAVVSAQQFIHPRLFKKRGAMVFPQLESKDGIIKADYVLLDRTNNDLNTESPAYISEVDFNKVSQNNLEWKLIKSNDGYELYERK